MSSESISETSSPGSSRGKDLGMNRMIMKARNRSARIRDHKCELISALLDIDKLYPLSFWKRTKQQIRQFILVSGKNRQCQTYLRSSAAVCFEEERQLVSMHWYIIHPFSRFRTMWQVIMVTVLLMYVFYTPWVLAFVMTDLPEEYTDYWVPIFILRFILFLDIGVTFITGILAEKTMDIILDPWVIARTYLRGSFVIDLITVLPWDIFMFFVQLEDRDAHYIALDVNTVLLTINFYKVPHMLRFLKDLFDVAGMSETAYHITYLLVFYTVYLHWGSCAQFILPFLVHGENISQVPNSWIVQYELLGEGNFLYKYSCATSRSFSLAMRLGYGRIIDYPRIEDAIISSIVLVIGFFLQAVIFGVILHLITSRYTSDLKYQSIMIELREYMRFKKLPVATQQRMFMYYENKFQKGYFKESAILATLSEGLREAIYMHCCHRLVVEVELFRNLPPDTVISIISCLHQEIYLPTDVIVKAGLFGDCMYFIQIGTAAVYTPTGKEVCHLQDGDYFGEITLVEKDTRRVASVVAVDICEVYRLDRADYHSCIASHKELHAKVKTLSKYRKEVTIEQEEEYKRQMKDIDLVSNLATSSHKS